MPDCTYNTIQLRSSEDLSGIHDGDIALTVTSPPYWNAIDYDIHSASPTAWYRTRGYRKAGLGYDEYIDWLASIFTGVQQKTRPGGFCAVVVGTVLMDGKHYPLPFELASRMVAAGWHFHEDIVWHKVTGGVKRAGTFMQHPYPGYFYPNIMREYILIFRNPGPPCYAERTKGEKECAEIGLNDYFKKEIANDVWHIAPVPPGVLDHPCPFPEEIPYRLIMLYSYPGDLVFDPFVGSGQTTKVARHLGRRYLGYDIEQKYVAYSLKRLQEPLHLRDKQLLAVFDRVSDNLRPAKSLDGPAAPKVAAQTKMALL